MSASFTADDVVFSLAFEPDVQPEQRGLCLAGCSSGLYRSPDGGRIWHNLYDRLDMQVLLPTTAVLFSPQFSEDHTVFAGVAGNVFRSEDSGETWQGVYIASPLPTISCMAISPDYLHDGTLFAGTVEDGVFMSTNRGMLWKPVNFGLLDLNILSLALSPNFAQDHVLFAGVETGLFRSKNGARAWREVNLPGGYEPVLSLAFSPTFAADGRAYAGTESKGVLATSDRGQTWQSLPGDPPPGAVLGLHALRGDAAHNRLVALLDSGMYAQESGADWQPWNAQANLEEISAAAFLPKEGPVSVLAGCVGGKIQWVTG